MENSIQKKIIIVLIFAVLIFVFWFIFFKNKKINEIQTFGNIEIRQVDLSFLVDGKIDNVFVEEGDVVKKGQLLATLDSRDYEINLKKAYFQKEETFSLNEENTSKYERNKELCKAEIESDEYCTTLLNNKKQSNSKYKKDIENLEFQKLQLSYTKLFAPQDGIISTRAQEMGARVSKGQTVYVMDLIKPIWVRTYIKEEDLGRIKYGKKAKILTDTTDPKTKKKREYLGHVGYISSVCEFTPKIVQTQDLRSDLVYRIRVYIDNQDEYLRQGMPVTVAFNFDED